MDRRPSPRRHFEDFTPGEVIELGDFSLSEDEIVAFARQYDPQPFHVDPELAAESGFGGLIASGWQTVCSFMRLYVDSVLIHTRSLGSPGVEQLKWPRPVRPGDALQARTTVLECRPSRSRPEWGIVRSRGEVVEASTGEPVLQVEAVNFIARRGTDAPAEPVGSR